jgi:hypothetical protein
MFMDVWGVIDVWGVQTGNKQRIRIKERAATTTGEEGLSEEDLEVCKPGGVIQREGSNRPARAPTKISRRSKSPRMSQTVVIKKGSFPCSRLQHVNTKPQPQKSRAFKENASGDLCRTSQQLITRQTQGEAINKIINHES